jgi:hypothetical protein
MDLVYQIYFERKPGKGSCPPDVFQLFIFFLGLDGWSYHPIFPRKGDICMVHALNGMAII